MAEQRTKKDAAAKAECRIAEIVFARKAREIAKRFFDGEHPRALARAYGLSRGGVEQLIRVQCRLRAAR